MCKWGSLGCSLAVVSLRLKVNAALKTITANGVYKTINDKYFDVNIRGE